MMPFTEIYGSREYVPITVTLVEFRNRKLSFPAMGWWVPMLRMFLLYGS